MQHSAFADVGDEAGATFAEPREDPLMFTHEFRAEARLAPVSPRLRDEGFGEDIGFDLADVLQRLDQSPLLVGNLGGPVQVLQAAAAADAEMSTAGRHAIGGSAQQFREHAFVEVLLAPGEPKAHVLAGERVANEDRLPIDPADASPVVAQGVDLGLEDLRSALDALPGGGASDAAGEVIESAVAGVDSNHRDGEVGAVSTVAEADRCHRKCHQTGRETPRDPASPCDEEIASDGPAPNDKPRVDAGLCETLLDCATKRVMRFELTTFTLAT